MQRHQGAGRADLGVRYDIVTGADDLASGTEQPWARVSLNRLVNQMNRGGGGGGGRRSGGAQAMVLLLWGLGQVQTRGQYWVRHVFGRMQQVAGPPTLL